MASVPSPPSPSSPSNVLELKASAAPFIPASSLPPISSQQPASPSLSPHALPVTSPSRHRSARPSQSPRLLSATPVTIAQSDCTVSSGEAKRSVRSGEGRRGKGRGEVLTGMVEFQFAKKEEASYAASCSAQPLSAREKRQLRATAAWRSEYRELYVVAQCSIIFRPCGDDALIPYTSLSDEAVKWSLVQHARLLTDAPVKCPLCLDETSLPRVTECGHVYCSLCLLQMFSANSKHKVPCPICLVPFHMASTKAIVITISSTSAAAACSSSASPPQFGRPIVASSDVEPRARANCVSFSLLQRWRGSNCPMLVSHSLAAEQAPAALHAATSVHAPYSKFVVSCFDDAVWATMEAKELGSLLQQLIVNSESSDAELVKRYLSTRGSEGSAAIEAAEAAAAATAETAAAAAAAAAHESLMKSAYPPLSSPSASSPLLPPPLSSSDSCAASSKSQECVIQHQPDDAAPVTESGSLRCWASARLKDTMRYVFAQACDGSMCFMHPINSRMLLHHIAATGLMPSLLHIPVLHTAHVTIDEDSRSRYKWMAHLPLFTTVAVVDVNLNHVVGPLTMEAFKQELLHRSLRWAQPVAETDNVKSEPSSSLSAQQPHPRDSSACGPSGQGRSNHRWAAGVSADGCASLSEESYIESDARLAMQLSMQELVGTCHSVTPEDFPLIRSVSEGGSSAAALSPSVWAQGRGGGGSQSFAAVASLGFRVGEEGVGHRRRSGNGAVREDKIPAPAEPVAPKGAWGKK